MDSTVPGEAMVAGWRDVASLRDAGEGVGDDQYACVSPQCLVTRPVTTLRTRLCTTSDIALRGSVGTALRLSTSTTLRGFAAGMVLPAPGGASHLSEMLTLPARTAPPTPSLGEAERTQCR
jgi:hypothetical protein